MCVLGARPCPTVCHPVDHSPPGSPVHGDSPGKNTGAGCHALLEGVFPPRDQTPVSCTAGGFFTIRATREAHQLIPRPHFPHTPSLPSISRAPQWPITYSQSRFQPAAPRAPWPVPDRADKQQGSALPSIHPLQVLLLLHPAWDPRKKYVESC